ncbi:MAG: hypothetical protein ACOX5G_07610 [Kiritimatiellia bacterium]|jgi:hypothetical protein
MMHPPARPVSAAPRARRISNWFARNGAPAILATAAVAVVLFFQLDEVWTWSHEEPLVQAGILRNVSFLFPPDRIKLFAWLVPLAILAWMAGRRPDHDDACPPPAPIVRGAAFPILFMGLILFLVSSIPDHPCAYYMGWMPGDPKPFHHAWGNLERVLFLAACLTPLTLRTRRWGAFLVAMLLAAQVLAFAALMKTTGGLPLYRDDHPSFLFRLHEFALTFPRNIDYNPFWNAGVVNWTATSSGTTGPGLLFLPLLRWCPVHLVYTPLCGALFIVIMPWLAVASLRAIRAGWAAAAIAGLLALCTSRNFFLWAFHFGTIGACFAISFYPLFMALGYRILVLRRHGWKTLLAWTVSAFFLLQWPPCAIMAALLAPGALLTARHWRWPSVWRLAVAAAVVALLFLPTVLLLLTQGTDLLDFVGRGAVVGSKAPGATLPAFSEWIRLLIERVGRQLVEANPLLVFFGVAGACVLPWKNLRRWVALPIALLLLLSAWGSLLAPRMQLERMALPAFQLAIVPAAAWMAAALYDRRPAMAVPRALLLSLLALGIFNVRELYRARGFAPFHAQPQQITSLVDWVRGNVPEDARLLFLGKNIHGYGGGHIAYLPILAGREMMASDYYGFPPGMIDEIYPPRPYRKQGAEGVARFARLHRVTHLVTYNPTRYVEPFGLREAPGLFREIPDLQDESLFLFEVLDPAESLFEKGTGRVQATFNRIVVDRLEGQDEVVLRYNWDPRLEVSRPAEIFPVEIEDDITFIGVRTHGAERAVIRLKGLL